MAQSWLMCQANAATRALTGDSYLPPTGSNNADIDTEANVQCRSRDTYTWKNLWVYITTNALSVSLFRSRINGSNGAQLLTLISAQTGVYEDTSNTDSIVTGDLFNIFYDSITADVSFGGVGSLLDHSGTVCIQCSSRDSASTSASSFARLAGTSISTTVEADNQITWQTATALSHFRIYLLTAGDSNETFRVKVNGANGAQLVSPLTPTTGAYEDTSNSDSIVAGDEVAVVISDVGTAWAFALIQCESSAVLRFATREGSALSSDQFYHINGADAWGTTEDAGSQQETLAVCNFKNLFARVSAFTRSVNPAIHLRANGVSQVSLTIAGTGFTEETSTTFSSDDNDLMGYMYDDAGGTGTCTVQTISIEQIPAAVGGDPEGSLLQGKLLRGGLLKGGVLTR